MAFNVTYHRLAEYNIRNLYGGLPEEIRFRQPRYTSPITSAQRHHEQRLLPPKHYDERFYDFHEEFDIRLPRAPAFRILSRQQVDDIVSRLSQATVSSASRRWKPGVCERGVRRSLTPRCSSSLQTTPISPRSARSLSRTPTPSPRPMSRREMDDVTDRLLRPTVSANVRNRMKTLGTYNLRDIQTACVRSGRPPSSRWTEME